VLNAPEADVFLVYAQTDTEKGFDGGATCFLIEKGAAGVEVAPAGPTVGYRTASMGGVSFDGTPAGPETVLGGIGQAAAVYAGAIAWERTLIASVVVGRMDKLLEASIQHARTRKSGGQPIGKHQAVSHKVTDMKMRLEVARLLSYKAAWQLDQGAPAGMDASISKLFASESMVQSSFDATQIFGGQGFLEEIGVGRSLRDALGDTFYAGTSAVQRNAIAEALGL
jgi:alkylation response protein AidB-like acyl-CoA dehydrogenase